MLTDGKLQKHAGASKILEGSGRFQFLQIAEDSSATSKSPMTPIYSSIIYLPTVSSCLANQLLSI